MAKLTKCENHSQYVQIFHYTFSRVDCTSQTTQNPIFLSLFSHKNGISSLIQTHFQATQVTQNQIKLSFYPTPNLQKANFLKQALIFE